MTSSSEHDSDGPAPMSPEARSQNNNAIATGQFGRGPLSPRFTQALDCAASLHRFQYRKGSRVPYLSHLLAVSALVLEDGGSEDEAIGGLLHDAVEDCGVEVLPYLRQEFGERVAAIVEACSDTQPRGGEQKPPWPERKAMYIAHLKETSNLAAVRVSAADKLHNARSTLIDIQPPNAGEWPAFNACKHQLLWYYGSIAQIVTDKLESSRTAVDLAGTVARLFEASDVKQTNTFEAAASACPAQPPCTRAAKVTAAP